MGSEGFGLLVIMELSKEGGGEKGVETQLVELPSGAGCLD